MFLAQTTRCVDFAGEKYDAAGPAECQDDVAKGPASSLARVFVPSEPACWRYLARCWSAADEGLGDPAAKAEWRRRLPRFSSGGGFPETLGRRPRQEQQQEQHPRPPRGKPWSPVACLWTQRTSTLVEPPRALREPFLQRFAEVIEEAATLPRKPDDRDVRRRLTTLLGLHLALRQVTAAPLRGVSKNALLSALRAVVATIALLCAVSGGVGAESSVCAGSARVAVPHDLLAECLRCIQQLLKMLIADVTVDADLASSEVVDLLVRGKPTAAATTTAVPGAAGAAAALIGGDMLETRAAVAATEAFALMVCAMFRLRFAVWPASERRPWAARLVKELVGRGLDCQLSASCEGEEGSGRDDGAVRVSMPTPSSLLGALGVGADVAGSGGSTADFGGERLCKSLSVLLAALNGSRPARNSAMTPSLGQAMVISLRTSSPAHAAGESHAPNAGGEAVARSAFCAGLTLAVLGRCMELSEAAGDACACEGEEQADAEAPAGRRQAAVCTMLELAEASEVQNGGTSQCSRAWMTREVAAIVRFLEAHAEQFHHEAACLDHLQQGLGALVHSMSRNWPVGEDEKLWQATWVPLVADWAQLLASAPTSAKAPLEARGDATKGTDDMRSPSASCCGALCAGTSTNPARREHVVDLLAIRAGQLAMRIIEEASPQLSPLLGVAAGLAAVLQSLPFLPRMKSVVASRVATAAHGVLALSADRPGASVFGTSPGSRTSLLLAVSAIALNLYTHLAAAQQQRPGRAIRERHYKLGEAEALLLHTAGALCRAALQPWYRDAAGVDDAGRAIKASSSADCTALVSSAYGLMHALFSSVPVEGKRPPSWAQKPHIIMAIFKAMLEALYAAPSGADAAVIGSELVRLWEAFSAGGTRLVTRRAGRSGQSIYQARVQRATQNFVIMIIAHALEQQRQWAGVDAAVERTLLRFDPKARAAARASEAASWREAVSVLQDGFAPLFDSLEGADHIKQALYASLREPLNNMFKELHESFQKRTKYRGEA